MATDVTVSESFEPIPDVLLENAKQKIKACKKVICCRERFGSMEMANQELLMFAIESGKMVEFVKFGAKDYGNGVDSNNKVERIK